MCTMLEELHISQDWVTTVLNICVCLYLYIMLPTHSKQFSWLELEQNIGGISFK